MEKIVLDAELRKKLPDLNRPYEFCDETGTVLGHYIPDRPPVPNLSREEMERRLKEPRFSTEDVRKFLKSL